MTTERWFEQDVAQPIVVQHCEGVVFTADNNGNIIGVKLYKDGAAFNPSGTATCNVIRPDGVTVSFNGTVSGNAISATLPVTALAVPGVIGVVLQSISGSVVTTVFKGMFTCEMTTTETVVAPSVPTSSLAQLTQDVIDLQNGKVNKSGDTMTGTLTSPRLNTLSTSFPAIWYMTDGNTDIGYHGVRVSDRRFVIAYRNGAGINQQFSLPPLSGDTSASTWYDILTTKEHPAYSVQTLDWSSSNYINANYDVWVEKALDTVRFQGVFTFTNLTANTTVEIGTLPVGYRPNNRIERTIGISLNANWNSPGTIGAQFVLVSVYSDGIVKINPGSTPNTNSFWIDTTWVI